MWHEHAETFVGQSSGDFEAAVAEAHKRLEAYQQEKPQYTIKEVHTTSFCIPNISPTIYLFTLTVLFEGNAQ